MFDLSAPMKGCVMNQGRYLFLEGDLKYKDNTSKVKKIDCVTMNVFLNQDSKYKIEAEV